MGKGNYLLPMHNLLAGYGGYYIDLEALYGEEYWESEADDDYFRERWDDFKVTLVDVMSKKFQSLVWVDKHKWDGYSHRYVLMENNLVELIICEEDTYMAVYFIIPLECEREILAKIHLQRYINHLKMILLVSYPNYIRERCGPWTSSRVA